MNNKKILSKKNQTKKGISLVISLIMMTLLLSISFSISNIILRQLRLTNINTNSQTAFYAADSALECALYFDTFTDGTVSGDTDTAVFGTTTIYATGAATPIKCGYNTSNPLGFNKTNPINDIATTTFDLDYGRGACAHVEVVKAPFRTKISTSGYNTGVNADMTGCDISNAISQRVVERGLVFSH